MRLQGIVTKHNYTKGVSESTSNEFERCDYLIKHQDAEGHNHMLTFRLSGQALYDAGVHDGDWVEVSVQLGLREWNGMKFNNVMGVYFVKKVSAMPQPMTAAKPAPQTIQPSAPVFQQGQAQQAQPMMAVNNQPQVAAPQGSTADKDNDLPF